MEGYAHKIRFAVITDLHLGQHGADRGAAMVVGDINRDPNIDFVALLGDLTEAGRDSEYQAAAEVLGALNKTLYSTTGNRDTKFPESWLNTFSRSFGSGRFCFEQGGYLFIGVPTGPYVQECAPTLLRENISFIREQGGGTLPVVMFMHHQPDMVANIELPQGVVSGTRPAVVFCGHLHANNAIESCGVQTFICASALRNKQGGICYNIVEIEGDALKVINRDVAKCEETVWWEGRISPSAGGYAADRGALAANGWKHNDSASILGGLCPVPGGVVYGNTGGLIKQLTSGGDQGWEFATDGCILSTPVYADGRLYCGSTDSTMYCLNAADGSLVWKCPTDGAIGADAAIDGQRLLFGTSAGTLYSLDTQTGAVCMTSTCPGSLIYSTPLLSDNLVMMGGIYGEVYLVDRHSGKLRSATRVTDNLPRNAVVGTRAVRMNDLFCFSTREKQMIVMDADSGRIVCRDDNFAYSPCLGASGDTLYARLQEKRIVAMRHDGGEALTPLWSTYVPVTWSNLAQPLWRYSDRVYVPDQNGMLYVLDALDGRLLASQRHGDTLITSVAELPDNRIAISLAEGSVIMINNN